MAHPRLLTLSAGRVGPSLTVTTPLGSVGQELVDGTAADVEYWNRRIPAELFAGPCADALSDVLGRDVLLARAIRGRFVYAEPVTFVLASGLRDAATRLGMEELEARRFRANLVIDDTGEDVTARPVGHRPGWLGRTIQIGAVTLSVTDRVRRCTVVDHDPDTGERDLPLFRSLDTSDGPPAEHCFGYAATVLTTGSVHVGDDVRRTDVR